MKTNKLLLGATLLASLFAVVACGETTPSTEPSQTPSTSEKVSTPAPSSVTPSTPAQSTPAPSTPAPSTPAPSTPAPSTPAPSTPAPSTPAPSTPAPSVSTPEQTENTVKGRLVDNYGDAVKNVTICLNVAETLVARTVSGEDGTFSFTEMEAGTYNILLVTDTDAYEYKGNKISFTYESGVYDIGDIRLEKNDIHYGTLN